MSPLLGLFSNAYLTSKEPNLQDVELLFVASATRPTGWTPLLMLQQLFVSDRIPGFATCGVHRIHYVITPQRHLTTTTSSNGANKT